ncbi:MAG: hypothetical protein ACOX4U_08425 [Anaerovoracaceae bacterium]|jgi:hypothetical protein
MIELFDNILQLVAALLATVGAGLMFYKYHLQAYLLLTCFFATFMLGSLYWTLHYLLFCYTPQIFYVSELAWVASHIFLLTLACTLASPEERKFKHFAIWLAPVFCISQLILYLSHADVLFNTMVSALALAIMWYALRGLLYARQQTGKQRERQYFHLALLAIIILEHGLWTSSCFWLSDSLTNPYFWIDFLLTMALVLFLPATRKAVAP